LPSTRTLAYRQAGLLLIVGACFGCAEGVPIGDDDVVILPQLPDFPDASARDASAAPAVAALPQGVTNPVPGASAPGPSPAPIPPATAPVVATDAGIADAGSATDAGG